MSPPPASVDDYVASYPPDVRAALSDIRRTVHEVVPGAGEAIRYGMPAITLDGTTLVYFAAWKRHIGFYDVPVLAEPLESEIAAHRTGRDTVRFPLGEPLPLDLVRRLVTALRERRGPETAGDAVSRRRGAP